MFTGFLGHFAAFQEHLHQIDAATGPVPLVVQFLVGWAGCGAETAMHTGPEDLLRFLTFGIIGKLLNQIRLHNYNQL